MVRKTRSGATSPAPTQAAHLREQADLREQDERLRLALTATGMGTWEFDLVAERRTWSAQTRRLHGLDPTVPPETHVVLTDTIIHPEDRDRQRLLHRQLLEGRNNYEFEYRTLGHGEARWIAARGTVVERSAAGPTRIVGVCWDITNERRVDELRRSAEESFRQLSDAMPQLVWVCDAKGRNVYRNRRQGEFWGGQEGHDDAWSPVIHPDDQPVARQAWANALKSGTGFAFEKRLRMADGSFAWFLSRAVPQFDPSGQLVRWFGTSTDIDRLKRIEQTLSESEERLRLATEAADMFGWDINIAENRLGWAPNAAQVLGCAAQDISDDPAHGAFFVAPADRARILDEFNTVLVSGGETYSIEFDGTDLDSDRAHWVTHGRIIRKPDGTPERAVGVTQNVTRTKRAQDALKLTADRLSNAEMAAGAISYDLDASTGRLWRGHGVTRVLGWAYDEIPLTAQAWNALMHPDDRKGNARPALDAIVDANGHYSQEYRLRHKAGHYVWVQDSGRAFRNKNGDYVRFTGVTVDISQRRSSEDAVRRQARLIDLSFDPIFVWHPERGIVEWNNGAAQLYGHDRAEAIGKHSWTLLGTRNRPSPDEILAVLRNNGGWSGDIVQTAKDGSIIHVECRLQLMQSEGDDLVLETNHDITERKRTEVQQQLMTRELAHRVKNSFAVLQAILRSTIKSTKGPEEFAEAFSGRLQSLAAAQDILTASEWRGAELGALTRHILASYGTGADSRIILDGPVVNLPPDLAAPMGLVLNELATNAAKYGALSVPAGQVHVDWRIRHNGPQTRLVLEWRETGGPAVSQPKRLGFGTTLIERSLATATVTRMFHSDGLHCTLELDLYPVSPRES